MTMTTLLTFLNIPLLHAEVDVSYTVSDHHIAGQSVIVDIQLFNNGTEPETIPDIGLDRWRVEFTVNNLQGTQRIHSTKPEQATEHQRTLAPRQIQEIRFEIPNSAAWVKGDHKLSIQTPLTSTTPFEQTIVVHPQIVSDIDWTVLSNPLFTNTTEVLWLMNAENKEQYLFQGIKQSQYLATVKPNSTYGSSVHLGSIHHMYWIEKQQLNLQSRTTDRADTLQRISIPWPHFETIGSAMTDVAGRFMLPIWVSQGNSETMGTLQLVIVDRTGTLSFRKLYQGTRPHQTIQAITQANIPLIGFHTDTGAWMMSLTEVGDPTVDRLPPKSIRLFNTTPKQHVLDMTFAISDTEGLFIGVLTSQHPPDDNTTSKTSDGTPQFQFHQYSIQGKVLNVSPFKTIDGSPTGIEYVNQAHYMTGNNNTHHVAWDAEGNLLFIDPRIQSSTPGRWSTASSGLQFWTLEDGSLTGHTLK